MPSSDEDAIDDNPRKHGHGKKHRSRHGDAGQSALPPVPDAPGAAEIAPGEGQVVPYKSARETKKKKKRSKVWSFYDSRSKEASTHLHW